MTTMGDATGFTYPHYPVVVDVTQPASIVI